MADKTIGELESAAQLNDASLIPMEQNGVAMSISGRLLRQFAEQAAEGGGGGLTEAEKSEMEAEITAAVLSAIGSGGGGGSMDISAYTNVLDQIAAVVRTKTGYTIDTSNLSGIASAIGAAIDAVIVSGSSQFSRVQFTPSATIARENISRITIGAGDGASVLSLKDGAFWDQTALVDISLPNTLTVIGDSALRGTRLTALNLPASVETVYAGAFRDIDSLTRATIRSGRFYNECFLSCRALEYVSIADSVVFSGAGIFCWCTALKGDIKENVNDEDVLTIPSATHSIPEGHCELCVSLTKVRFKGAVSSIGAKAFRGRYYDYDNEIGVPDSRLSTLVFDHPESLVRIGWWAFRNCKSLVFTFTNAFTSLERIESCAFQDCVSLQTMLIPGSVQVIEGSAFRGCTSLQTLTVISGVQQIDGEAFRDCTSLSSVTLPASLSDIGEYVFHGCPLLTSAGPAGSGANIIMHWTTRIPSRIFSGNNALISVQFPTGITSIGYRAFADTALQSTAANRFVIPSSVTSIENEAFWGTGITYVTIQNANCHYRGDSFPDASKVSGGINDDA